MNCYPSGQWGYREGKSRNIPLSTFRLKNHTVFLIVKTLTPKGNQRLPLTVTFSSLISFTSPVL